MGEKSIDVVGSGGLMKHASLPAVGKAKTIIAVQAERIENGKGYDFVRFYISSRALDATSALKAAKEKAHWSVENLLHWTLDIAFGRDQLQARAGFAGEKLSGHQAVDTEHAEAKQIT